MPSLTRQRHLGHHVAPRSLPHREGLSSRGIAFQVGGTSAPRSAPVWSVLVVLMLLSLLAWTFAPSAAAAPAGLTEGWTKVVSGGFNDPANGYAPFYTVFHGYLYVSTIASTSGSLYAHSDKLGGDIWRTKDGITWEQMGKPGLGNTDNFTFSLVTFRNQLYAIGQNAHGLQIWMSGDGVRFTQIERGGFGDADNTWASAFVFNDRLILGVDGSKTGAQIWVSQDGRRFDQVVEGGLGDKGNTGIVYPTQVDEPLVVFKGHLYLGVTNPTTGAEIWRTADGLKWERVADKGLGRATTISFTTQLVFKDQLYVVGMAGGSLNELFGFELFRTSDGTTWEKVVKNGFDVGHERNVAASLVEFDGRLLLASSTMDPRLLLPNTPKDRIPPKGFQLRTSSDGATWSQVGKDGFGADTRYLAMPGVIDGVAYLSVFDYHQGDELYRSTDGTKWQVIFGDPDSTPYSMGGGAFDYAGHLLWIDNDMQRGVELWRTDQQVVADATTTSVGAGASTTTPGDHTTQSTRAGAAGGAGASGGDGGATSGGNGHQATSGLSGPWLALLIVVGVVAAVAAIGVALLAFTQRRTRAEGGSPPAAEVVPTQAVTAGTTPPAFCPACGAALPSGAGFCPGCGRRL